MIISNQAHGIAQLNDNFRCSLIGGTIVFSAGMNALSDKEQSAILKAVQQFNAFNLDNDPHREHDFGAFDFQGKRIFWKIDYYDLTMTLGSEYPEDPTQTSRVLIIMLADEY